MCTKQDGQLGQRKNTSRPELLCDMHHLSILIGQLDHYHSKSKVTLILTFQDHSRSDVKVSLDPPYMVYQYCLT